MLTKSDLSEIGKVVDIRLKPIHKDIKNLQKGMTIVKKDVKYLKKELKFQSNILDNENIKTLKRVKTIEEHLKIPSPDFV